MTGARVLFALVVVAAVALVDGAARARIYPPSMTSDSGAGSGCSGGSCPNDLRLDASNDPMLAPLTVDDGDATNPGVNFGTGDGMYFTNADPYYGGPAVVVGQGLDGAGVRGTTFTEFGPFSYVTTEIFEAVASVDTSFTDYYAGGLATDCQTASTCAYRLILEDPAGGPGDFRLQLVNSPARAALFDDDATTTPNIAFEDDSNTGIGRTAADTLCQYTGGTCRSSLTTTTLTHTVPLLGPTGSAAAPAYSFTGASSNSGLYLIGADVPALSVDGTAVWYSNGLTNRFLQGLTPESTTLNVGQDSAQTWDHFFGLGNAPGDPTYSFGGNSNTGVYSSGANLLDFSTNGVRRGGFGILSFDSTVPVYVPVGSAPEPTYSFVGRTDDGVFSPAANEVAIAIAGVETVTASTGALAVAGQIAATGLVEAGASVRAATYLRSVGAVGIAPGSLPSCTGASSTQGGQIYHVDDGTDSDYCMCLRAAGTYGWVSATSRLTVCP